MASAAPVTPGARRLDLRTKRHQVSKACDSCRAHRIKCDSGRPCLNCQARSRVCTQAVPSQAATLSAAHKEIDELRQRVLNLEQELRQERSASAHPGPPATTPTPTPTTSSTLLSASTHQAPPSQPDTHDTDRTWTLDNGHAASWRAPIWQGTLLRPPRSPHASWFGPSSLYDFARRFSTALRSRLQPHQPPEDHQTPDLLPEPAGSAALLNSQRPSQPSGLSQQPALSVQDSAAPLTPTQEQHFIGLFWESYHTCVFPILDETEFKEHHHRLWAGGERKPSALADMVLAICMQIGVSALPADQQGAVLGPGQDATVAGCFFYRRSQRHLAQELDSPTYATLQCHLLAAVYQCGGSFHNMVDGSAAQALRVAYMLGLHVDPSVSGSAFDEKERQRRRILWWAVYLLDSKVGMKFGRPFLIHDHGHSESHGHRSTGNDDAGTTMPRFPDHDFAAARLSGSTFGPLGANGTDVSWLSFHVWHTKLYMAARHAHRTLYETDVLVASQRQPLPNPKGVWGSPRLLDAHADILLQSPGASSSAVRALESWAESVPAELKTPRRDGGFAFSTDGTALEMEVFAPVWFQRQRLLLEAAWHHQMACTFRVFISFHSRHSAAATATADSGGGNASDASACGSAERLASLSASHAVAFTRLAHQVLTTSSLLDGWHEMFQWQWSAAMVMAGYLLGVAASPGGTRALAVRDALPLAVVALDAFGDRFGIARDAARIVKVLMTQIDGIAAAAPAPETRQGRYADPQGEDPILSAAVASGGGGEGEMMALDGMLQGVEGHGLNLEGLFTGSGQDLLDLALSVDFWGDVDALWPAVGLVDQQFPM